MRKIAKHKVPEFVEWLRSQGWETVPTKGAWEMVRMCDPVGRLLLIFDKRTKEHATIQNEYVHLIEEWLNHS